MSAQSWSPGTHPALGACTLRTAARTTTAFACLCLLAWGAPSDAWEPAARADDFVDRVGVATHWGYPDTPYGYAYDEVSRLLGESGIRHVRDGFHPRELDLYARYGIRATVIVGPDRGTPEEHVAQLAQHAEILDAIEGPNEVDIFASSANYQGQGFPEGPIAFQRALYRAATANERTATVPVIAPSIARRGSNLKLAPLDAFDYLVMHPYAGGGPPGGSLDGEFSNILEAARILGRGATLKPYSVTESGYHTALQADQTLGGVQPGVPESIHAKYIPRHFAECFRAGMVRTIVYEFINEFADEATNAEASFGLVRRDLTPKPGYLALRSLIGLLREGAWDATARQWRLPVFRPQALDFQLDAETDDVHHVLLQKSDGRFYLLLWREVTSYDTREKRVIENAPAAVRVVLPIPARKAGLYRLGESPERVREWTTASELEVVVPDEVVVVELDLGAAPGTEGPDAPSNLSAGTQAHAAAMEWSAVPGAEGYFVWRLGRYVGFATEAAFEDTGLQPDTGYPYEVAAFDARGCVSERRRLVAHTAAQYPDLAVADITWEPPTPAAGDEVVFGAILENHGNGAAPAGIVHGVAFRVDGEFISWSDTLQWPLPPGESVAVKANNGPQGSRVWKASPGEHTVVAEVDDVDRINESDETNNTCGETLTVAAP